MTAEEDDPRLRKTVEPTTGFAARSQQAVEGRAWRPNLLQDTNSAPEAVGQVMEAPSGFAYRDGVFL